MLIATMLSYLCVTQKALQLSFFLFHFPSLFQDGRGSFLSMLCLLLPWKRVTKIDLVFVYCILISVPRGLVFFVFTRLIPRLTNFQTFRCVLRTLSSFYDTANAEVVEIAFTEIVHLIKKTQCQMFGRVLNTLLMFFFTIIQCLISLLCEVT